MRVLFSGFIDPSHSSFGGYHNILGHPFASKVLLTDHYPLGKVSKKYHLRKIPLWFQDFDTRLKRYQNDITHLFYGEITMCPFFPYSKSKSHKTVITLHLDIEKQHLHSFFLKNLPSFDGIIVLSTQQQKYYKERYGIETTFIPHGFNSPIFNHKLPTDIQGRSIDNTKINLITSGKNYRDFLTLEKAISFSQKTEWLHFHIVGAPKEIKDKLIRYSANTSIYNRISDDEYYTLIQTCDYHFLPLTFATANNALLEAQSLGVTSILPKIPGVSDYAAPAPLNLYYGDFNSLVNILDCLEKNNISQELIDYSTKFHWNNIYTQLTEFYQNLYK